ncbi:MAG: serine/threonine-protein kinase [Kofleriaceae bacterium]
MAADRSFASGLVGIVLDDRYRLDALLGEGGMGAVFRAQHLAMDRRVAIKLLKPHLTADATALQRFAREARSTLKVDSPHAVKVLDFGITPHGDYYMALEYLDGRTVQRELDVDGPFDPGRVLHIARQALDALGAAHRIGLVHRDIKPDNILLMRAGGDGDYVKLLDFGVAKLMEGAGTSERSNLALTQAGMVFGTPEFMSPEQACGHALDGRSDLYSLAATMFVMLTGQPLFQASSAIEWLTHQVRTPAPRLATIVPELARYPALDQVVQRCLAKQRDLRPQTADEMAQLLGALEPLDRPSSPAKRSTTTLKPAVISASSYLTALPQETLDPGQTLPPPQRGDLAPAPQPAPPELAGPTTTGVLELVAPRRRWPAVAAMMAIVAAVITLVALRRRPSSATGSITGDAGIALAPVEIARDAATVMPAAPLDATPGASLDASLDASIDAPRRIGRAVASPRPPTRAPLRTGAAAAHLRAAEEALRTGNRLRQLSEADLALEADPRNVRARYLLADALIKGGDLDRGCEHLRLLGRNSLALARARAAKCPMD